MKVTVIGGGSTYTPELVKGFLDRVESFPLDELWLVDISPERLEVVGGFVQRMVAAQGEPFKVNLTTDRRLAIQDSSYVITQLRVGAMAARRDDEYLGKRHGLIGQETTGIGGMAKALRTIPVVLEIAADMQVLAPGSLLVNFTNPAGLVTEALFRHAPQVPAVGVCNDAITTKMGILKQLDRLLPALALKNGVHLEELERRSGIESLGLNHLTWYRGFTLDGEDLWPQVFKAFVDQLKSSSNPEWDVHTIESLGMRPNSYLRYYYYTGRKLQEQQAWPPSRAEQVMEIEAGLLHQYADPSLYEPPPGLMKRGGAFYSTLATQLLDSHYNNLGQVHVVNTRQAGAVADWPQDWVLELPCRVDNAGVHPLSAAPLPEVCFGLIAQVKSYELLTVEAAVFGDRQAAYQALLAHPLGPPADQVQAVLDDLLETNRTHLPQFWN